MDKEKLKVILKDIKEMTHDLTIIADADMVLEQAVKIYITETINGFPKQEAKKEGNGDMASEKQKALLNKLGYVPKDNLTMKEASKMIKEKLDG